MKIHSPSFRALRGQPRVATRGSILIVSMLLCAIIGISIASYLQLGRTSLTISNRALYNNAAMNLAENGLEEAMYSINKMVEDTTYTWSDWNNNGTNAWRQFPTSGTYTFDQNATGLVRVYAYNYLGNAAPKFIARSIITLGAGSNGKTIEKWVMVQLRKTSKFSNGLVAKESLRFNGNNASVDSWNSEKDSDGNPRSPAVGYSTDVRDDNGSIGSISVAVGAVGVNNADIWGYASTGGALPSVGSNGLVGPFGTSTGTMDMSHVSTDFSASFDPVTTPAGGSSLSAIGNGDLPTTIGTAGATATYRMPSISATGNSSKVLTIEGHVTLILTNTAGSSAISMGGQSSIAIAPGASLTIYTEGNIDIGGNGIANGGTSTATANQPINFQIWGTNTSTVANQDIKIAGNGVLSAVVYAPNADVTINGNGDVMGSVVAENITMTGNATFHYDESLANMSSGNPFRIASWRELTQATERASSTYTVLNRTTDSPAGVF
ncbi:MAG: hypothetical protein HYV95_17700 [Opitutae bacterium]|nr:hypothetical protein [Opitutae bacterium]